MAHPDCPQRRARGRTGRNAIIDDDRDTMSDVGPFAAAQIAAAPAFYLGKLGVAHGLEFRLVHPCQPDDIIIANHDGVRPVNHGSHGQFGL